MVCLLARVARASVSRGPGMSCRVPWLDFVFQSELATRLVAGNVTGGYYTVLVIAGAVAWLVTVRRLSDPPGCVWLRGTATTA